MKKPIKKLSDRVKEKLIARGLYDTTPDTNIERLNKSIVDNITKKLEVNHLQKSPLIKTLEKNKKKNKEKPIRTSLLLCTHRF